MNRISAFIRLPALDRILLIEAACFLCVSWLAIQTLPFRWVSICLGKHMVLPPFRFSHQKTEIIPRISKAVNTMSRHMPFSCACLAQAMACKQMLKIRRIPSTVYLGLAKKNDQNLLAHAWLQCDKRILTGQQGSRDFTIVSYFS